MRRWMKGLALFIAIVCLVWVGVLWRWQVTHRDMSADDIVLYLGVLPVVLFVLVLLARWALRGADASAKAKAAASAAAAAATPATGAVGAAVSGTGEAERQQSWALLAAGLNCAAGSSPQAVAQAVQAGEPRPTPDDSLCDEQGLPVISARIDGLDLTPHQEALAAALAEAQAQWASSSTGGAWAADEAVPRALVALHDPLQTSLSGLSAWADVFALPDADAPARSTVTVPSLRVLVQWPAHWNACERLWAQAWLRQVALACSGDWLPPSQWRWMPELNGPQTSLLAEGDRLLASLQRDGLHDVLLLVAAQSDVSEQRVNDLQRAGQLFTPRQAKAGVLTESAAVLVLAGPQWPAAPEAEAPQVRLHRPAQLWRDKPVDSAGRVSAATAEAAAQQALLAAGLAAAQIHGLISDADQHSPRATELFSTMLAPCGHLDAAEDTLVAGAIWGRTGPVAPLLVTALAAHRAQSSEGPCLALSVDDPLSRLALVARQSAEADSAMKKTDT